MSAQQQVGPKVAFRQLYGIMSPRRRMHFVAVLALMLLGGIAETATIASVLPFLSLLAGEQNTPFSWLVDLLARFELAGATQRVSAAAFLFMGVALAAAAVRLLLAWSSQSFVFRLGHDIAVEINRRILLQPYSFHTEHNSSEVLASLEKGQVMVAMLLQMMQASAAAVLAAFIIVALIRVDPFTATIAASAFALLYLLVSAIAARALARNSRNSARAYDERLKLLQESLGGIRDVIIDHSQRVHIEAFRAVDRRFTEARTSTTFIAAAPRFIVEAAGMVVIAALALALTARAGALAPAVPILGAMALGAMRLLPFLQQLYLSWSGLAGHRDVVAHVLALLRLPVPDAPDGDEAAPPLPFTDSIRFEAVTFFYPNARAPALRDVNLTIPRGSRIALMGRSGSGKSTFGDLLMGLLEPTEGRIMVDDAVLTGDTRRAWRRSIAHVPQSIFLADASVARNIAFGIAPDQINHERMAEAVRIAQFEEVVEALPEGLETLIGEGGVRLSGGQRQRLGLARAIYKDAPVLVLDEATNALDAATESAVLAALDEFAARGRTVLIITHRPSTVAGCDRIIRLEAGRMVAGDGPDALPSARAKA
ncbi:MAG TPA: ABC transporter ATP-binding protein [Sphingomicrobium sp.]|nr:ABC transporter ATP-binding protein [Sphingomicrobium sp.]